MVLVDSSVWINHFKRSNLGLSHLLEQQQVCVHPFVIGELACGEFKNRKEIISLLHALPAATCADHDEVLFFIEQHKLMGRGIGLIDIHLLASCKTEDHVLWSLDRRLKASASMLQAAYTFSI